MISDIMGLSVQTQILCVSTLFVVLTRGTQAFHKKLIHTCLMPM